MESPGSSIRSAARATFSAYRSIPIRWRLAGGSAALTLVILAAFATVVGVLTDGQVARQFLARVSAGATKVAEDIAPTSESSGAVSCGDLGAIVSAAGAQIRVFDTGGNVVCSQLVIRKGKHKGKPVNQPPLTDPYASGLSVEGSFEVAARKVLIQPFVPAHGAHPNPTLQQGYLIYALPLSSVDVTRAKVRIFLLLGVLGGTIFALLAGLATAQRAIRPIKQLTSTAREIERTRDPTLRIPEPEADDEVAELARTLEGMLRALGAARAETEQALTRQREFVADASHELRTPLTSVLANLELLTEELGGEQAESAQAALRSTRRMRRLVGDLLLLARADVERRHPYGPADLGEVLTDAAAELGPVADAHLLTIDAQPARLEGIRDDLHRLVLNLLENAVRHTPPGTHISARSSVEDGAPTIVVEDDGPGIPLELRERVFDRFVRGGGDTGGGRGTGLGLAIVRAVAETHHATVTLGTLPDGTGTKFGITFHDGSSAPAELPMESAQPIPPPQTSTTTGSTIGRRRSRS